MMEYRTVCVDLSRYEELVALESRVNVVVGQIARDGYMRTEDLLFTLGTTASVMEAEKIQRESEERRKSEGNGVTLSMMVEE